MIQIGEVFKKFACGCIVPVSTPIHKAFHPSLKTKSGNRLSVTACPTHQTMAACYEYSFKVCPVCRQMVWTKKGRLRPGRCQTCGRKAWLETFVPGHSKPRTIRYYQHGREIPAPRKLVSHPMCRHRMSCLPNCEDSALHCGGCRYFEPEIIETMTYRSHDQYLYAEGY